MPSDPREIVRLQLAMAFGQGAGCMLANAEALSYAFSEHSELIERAARDWTNSKFAFLELVRLLGQSGAAFAAADGCAEIGPDHLRRAFPGVLGMCPCR